LEAAVEGLVTVDQPEHMNLLGLLIKGFMEQKLESPRLARKAKRLRGAFGLQAGSMAITLSFSPQGVVIYKGIAKRTRARISGEMGEMVELVSGGGGLISSMIAVLEGRVTIRGNPFALLGLLPIMTGKATKKALPPAAKVSPGESDSSPSSVRSAW
jgi:hypothetical protein